MKTCPYPDAACARDHRVHPYLRARNLVGQTAHLSIHETDNVAVVHLHLLHAKHPPEKPLAFFEVTPTALMPLPCLGEVDSDPWGRPAFGYDVSEILAPGSLFVAAECGGDERIYHGLVVEDPAAVDELPLEGAGPPQVLAVRRLSVEAFKRHVRALAAPGVDPVALMPVRGGGTGEGADAVSAAKDIPAAVLSTVLGADLEALVRLGGDPATVLQAYAFGILKAATFLGAGQ